MMMRINFKTVVLLLAVAVLSSLLTSWKNCNSSNFFPKVEWNSEYKCKVSPTFFSSITLRFFFFIN